MPRQSCLRQNAIEFILCCLSADGLGVCPEELFLYPVRLHWRKLSFPLEAIISWRQLLGQGWELVLAYVHFPSQCWYPIWLRPVQALCLLLQSLSSYEHQSFWCVESLVSLMSFIFSGSYNPLLKDSLSSEGRDLIDASHLELSPRSLNYSLCIVLLWDISFFFFFNFYSICTSDSRQQCWSCFMIIFVCFFFILTFYYMAYMFLYCICVLFI